MNQDEDMSLPMKDLLATGFSVAGKTRERTVILSRNITPLIRHVIEVEENQETGKLILHDSDIVWRFPRSIFDTDSTVASRERDKRRRERIG